MPNNYITHGLHLTVDAEGIVSLWDDALTALNVRGETYLFLPLEKWQVSSVEDAKARATVPERLE